MEKCTHCGRTNSNNDPWKQMIALFYEVEIKHSVCPQCSFVTFPKFYNIREVRGPAHDRPLNTVIDVPEGPRHPKRLIRQPMSPKYY